jgi:hypothetical protein
VSDGTLQSGTATVNITVQDTGGGEGESSPADALMLSLAGNDDWQDAVDEIMGQLG